MINFINSVGKCVARIDHTAHVVHTIMTQVDLLKEAYQQARNGKPGQRYEATNVIEVIKLHNYRVKETSALPKNVLPSECHIG